MFQSSHEPAHDLLGQAVGRNGVGQTAARLLLFLVHGHAVAALAQVTGRGQSRRAGTHDGDVFSVLPLRLCEKLIRVLQNIVPKETLDASHVQALVVGVAVTALHAEVGADATGDCGHGIDLQKHPGRALILSRPHHFHIGGNVCVGRTFPRTGSLAHFGRPENGVVPVLAHHSRTQVTALSGAVDLTAQNVGITVIPAADILADISGYRGCVAQIGGCHAFGRGLQRGPSAPHNR